MLRTNIIIFELISEEIIKKVRERVDDNQNQQQGIKQLLQVDNKTQSDIVN